MNERRSGSRFERLAAELDRDDDFDVLREALSSADPVKEAPPVSLRTDPFFVGRVMMGLPSRVRGTGLSPKRRARVLALFYGGAVALAIAVALIVPDAMLAWSDRAHTLAHDAAGSSGLSLSASWVSWLPLLLGALGAVLAGVLALAPSRMDTRPT